jgi:Matrixin
MTQTTRNELIKVGMLAASVAAGFLLAQSAFGASAAQPSAQQAQSPIWVPSQADLDAAVSRAATAWGVSVPVTISLDPAAACGVYNAARRRNKRDQDEEPHTLADVAAITDHKKQTGTTTTTITFAAGDIDDGSEPVRIDQDQTLSQTFVSTKDAYANYIHINAACEWSPQFLESIVLHEYGHALGIRKHSRDDRDIMYWMVYRPDAAKKYGAQSISAADRAMIPVQNARAK